MPGTLETSETLKRICTICDTVAALDRKTRVLRVRAEQLNNDSTVLRASWRMDADAISTTARADHHLLRLEKLESLRADMENIKHERECLTHEARNLFRELSAFEQPGAALVLRNYCGMREPFDALHRKGRI